MTRAQGGPIFVRILLVMLACVLAVQALNFALLMLLGPPRPPVYGVDQVAGVLRAGRDPRGEFSLGVGEPPEPDRGPVGAAMNGALSRQLGLPIGRVRLKLHDGPLWAARRPVGPRRDGPPPPDVRDGVLVGDFIAAAQRPDGRWLTVRPAHSRTGAWQRRALLWLLAALAAAAPFAWALSRRLARPIAMFARAAERLGRDPRAEPLPVEGPAEIAEAAAAFNGMQRRLNAYVEDRTVMIGAIAHDLRTPLMRLSLRLENAPEALRAACGRDVAEMQAMIVAATDYVRDVTRVGARRKLDLRSLAESVVNDHADRGGRVSLASGEGLVVDGDPASLKAAIDNLVGNALRYAGDAEVSIRREDGHALVEVRDHGPGIPEDDLPRIFEPFFRGERSRNRDTGGIGLGLASVRGVVRAHGGDVAIDNHPDGGVIARVTLPV